MSELARRLLDDARAGLTVDASGRRYFRPRRVRFQTLRLDAAALRSAHWLEFKTPLAPPDWRSEPSHRALHSFATLASERFRQYWYRVIDVAAARALFGRDTAIFTEPFFEGGTLCDLGIPEQQSESSVGPALHQAILDQYQQALTFSSSFSIYYLSQYLQGLTDDLIVQLAPFRQLWRLREERQQRLEALEQLGPALDLSLDELQKDGTTLRSQLIRDGDRLALIALRLAAEQQLWKQLPDAAARNLLHRLQRGELQVLGENERELIRRIPDLLGQSRGALALYERARGARPLAAAARSVAAILGQLHRLQLREIRLRRQGAMQAGETLSARRQFLLRQKQARDEVLRRTLHRWQQSGGDSAAARIEEILLRLAEIDRQIEALYQFGQQGPREATPTADCPPRFRFAGMLQEIPGEFRGDPLFESHYLKQARDIAVRRLRPVRRSVGGYSVTPGLRHGAMTLNPIMRLWKDRPEQRRGCPPIILQELNTRATADCLLRLATLVDPDLPRRQLQRERIVLEKRGSETLQNMLLLLLPGSCAPMREIHRLDFPDFRTTALGESRSPAELGSPPEEDGIVVGGWYQKFNHTLYYPVGGDNARLLRIIYDAARSPGPPAFFFALGQFVYDCLPDALAYFRSGELTFRECIEEYYLEEDRVRKNRGEKTGRRRADNSRPGVRFMFAVNYSRLMLEALSASSQSSFRHTPTEQWMQRNLGMPLLRSEERSRMTGLREEARSIIAGY
ncbi:MAG: hypothetical protein K1X75_07765 [Leptospirales bacterium]|nr:hypothetical protein [Leptospirales bacterium]